MSKVKMDFVEEDRTASPLWQLEENLKHMLANQASMREEAYQKMKKADALQARIDAYQKAIDKLKK